MKQQIHTRLTFSLLLLFFACSLSSCLDDRYDSTKEDSLAGGSLRLTALVPASGQATRALTGTEENYIQSIDMLIFTDDREGHETFAYYVKGEDIDNDSHATEKTFTARLQDSKGAFHRIYVFANLQEDVLRILSDLEVGMDKEEVMDRLTFYAGSPWNTTSSYRKLPMAGVNPYSLVVTPSTRPLQVGTIPLLRAVARIDVGLNMDQSYTPQGFADDLFYLTDTYIYNAMDSARALPYEASYESIDKKKVDKPSIPDHAVRIEETASIHYTHDTKGNGMMGEIYIAESDNNSSGITFQELSCLVIGGHYKNSPDKSWYRIDFFDKTAADTLNTWQDILRNHRYSVNITSVDGKGYPDPGTAFKSKQIDIQTQILRWEEGYNSDVIYDEKQNYLKVNKGKWEFPMDEVGPAATDNILTVETSWPTGWTVSKITDQAGNPVQWLSTSITSGPANTETEVSLLLELNDSGAPRTGYVHLTAGNLTYLVEVYQLSISIKYDCLYPLNGEIHTLTIKSSNSWTVTLTDKGGVINELLTSSGSGNISGEPIRFRTEKIDTPYENTGYLTISSPDFDDVLVPVRCGTGDIVPVSNSYIIKPGAMGIRIPVSRANEHTTLVGEADAITGTDILTAELVWTDNQHGISCESCVASVGVMGTGSDGYIQVWPGSAQGNALVAVKVNGTVKWSWHIWVTDYDPNAPGSTFSLYNGYSLVQATTVFMDRHLGALSSTPGDPATIGFHYQWGRKDPFPGAASFTQAIYASSYNAAGQQISVPSSLESPKSVGTATLKASIESPTTFYFQTGNYQDWYSTTSGDMNSYLWAGRNADKTIYDPCPQGWMVPRSEGAEMSLWSTLDLPSYPQWSRPEVFKGTWIYGWNFTDDMYPIGYYPAAGYRSPSNGNLYSIGRQGYSWSGVTNGVYGWAFQTNEDEIDRSAFLSRGGGISVRCVKDK